MKTEQIKDLITKVVIGFDTENLREDQNLLDAGIDSLEHMNILLEIEEQCGIEIPDEDIEECSSIRGILLYLQKNK